MKRSNNLLTILTPTYNRADTLSELYKSILKQNDPMIEWVVVDDGSSDETKKIIDKYAGQNIIKIRYYYQKNSGKHVAINNGIKHAKGRFTIIVDSDDKLCKQSIKEIRKYTKQIEEKANIAGIGGLKVKNDGNIIGKTFKGSYIDCTSLERRKYKIIGDKAEVFKTNILKKYKYPIIAKEKFMTEALVWNRIANDGYKIRWINIPLIQSEYREDGLTNNIKTIKRQNFRGYLLYYSERIKYENNILEKEKYRILYYSLANKFQNRNTIMKNLNIGRIRIALYDLISKIRGIQ